MKKFGITKADLGVTAHGLRHEYANDRYHQFAGVASPVRGGPPIERDVDRAARLRLAEELGHSRENITNAYLAGILKQPSDVATPTPAARVKAAAANADAQSAIMRDEP